MWRLTTGIDELSTSATLQDPEVRNYLSVDGGGPYTERRKWKWGPFAITIYDAAGNGEQLTFVIHGYKNTVTNQTKHGKDKVKFQTEITP